MPGGAAFAPAADAATNARAIANFEAPPTIPPPSRLSRIGRTTLIFSSVLSIVECRSKSGLGLAGRSKWRHLDDQLDGDLVRRRRGSLLHLRRWRRHLVGRTKPRRPVRKWPQLHERLPRP